jgi:ligand-binding sensor domain-containing protein/putative methionine-R-sulfoxide reductase with GAF domain/two-component sensor histidine kinase
MTLPKLLFSSLLTIVILAGSGNHLIAQDIAENNFTFYTKQEGLSNNNITGMLQDSIGYIWLATTAGLNRFNGSNFLQFHSGNDSASLPQDNISGLTWLDKYKLAIYTAEGLHIINTRTGETHNLLVPYSNRKYQYKFNGIMAAAGNAAGDIFLLTRSGFYHYSKDYKLLFRFDYYNTEQVPSAHFVFGEKLLQLDKQRLAVVSSAGIYLYNTANKQFKKMDAADCPLLKELLGDTKKDYKLFQPLPGQLFAMNLNGDSIVYFNIAANKRTVAYMSFPAMGEFESHSEMFAVSDSVFYIAGNISGCYQLQLRPGSGEIIFNTKKYFPLYICRSILKDKDNNLWVATNKGLFKQEINQMAVQRAVFPAALLDTIPNLTVDDFYATADSLYVGARRNGGLLVFEKRTLQFVRKISLENKYNTDNNVLCLAAVGDNDFLAGTGEPLIRINIPTGIKTIIELDSTHRAGSWIGDMCKGRNNTVWVIATDNIYKYDILAKTCSVVLSYKAFVDKVQAAVEIREDGSGNIWIAGHGLCRYNIHSNTIDRMIDSFPFIRIPDPRVNAFTIDQQNNIWINSNNNGLVCYNIDKGSYRHFTKDNGLPDNNIEAMAVIGNKLWMAGFSGISCLDLRTFVISSFGKDDGFPDLPVAKNSKFFYDSATDKIYIGFTNTIVAFDPAIVFQKSQPPQLFIESIITGDQKRFLFPGNNFTTGWRNNEVTVTIGSIDFFTSNSQRFAYRIVNGDSTRWQQLGTQNTFTVSNLAPGHYRVQVKLFSASNRWPAQVREIDIVISPPFWKMTWFKIMSVILFILLVYLILKWRTKIIRKEERTKTHIQKLKAEKYKNQFELEQISHYFSSSLANKKTVEEVLWDVAKNLIGRMNYVDCMIYVWNEDKSKMIQKASYGAKGDPVAITAKVFDVLPGQGVVGHVMETKEPLLIADTSRDDRYRVDDLNRLSEVCVPIMHNDELIGIIDSEHHNANYFKERDIQVLGTIATLVANKIKQIESEQSLELKQKEIAFVNQQLAEAQLSALQTQMNPHFIFNSLNSIKGMILANERQKASKYLSKFAQMIRTTLNQSKEIFTTLYENEEHLESYLAMEKLRFDDTFAYEIIVDEHIDKEEILIPTLMIQPLAENAIWHGLLHKTGEKKLVIRFSRFVETIFCTIEDNGIGIKRSEELEQQKKSPHQSVGLSNMRNRIKILNEKYGTGCTLEINDLQDIYKDRTGTRAVLRFNIITYKPLL